MKKEHFTSLLALSLCGALLLSGCTATSNKKKRSGGPESKPDISSSSTSSHTPTSQTPTSVTPSVVSVTGVEVSLEDMYIPLNSTQSVTA